MEIDGANQNKDYVDVAKAGTVNGRRMTQTLNVTDATTAAGTPARSPTPRVEPSL